MRCAFSGREIDQAASGWMKTPDGKVVYAQFYEGYLANLARAQKHGIVPKTEAPAPLEVKLEETVKVEDNKPAKVKAEAPKVEKKKGGRPPKVKPAPVPVVETPAAPVVEESPVSDVVVADPAPEGEDAADTK